MGLTTSIRSEPSKNSDHEVLTPTTTGAPTAAPGVDDLIESVTAVADDMLFPVAGEVDRGLHLPLAHFEALAGLGLYGMAVPAGQGGLGLAGPELRRVLRILGSGCGATSFAFAQHHGTAASIARTDNVELRDRWLPAVVHDQLAGIAYAHLRRAGPPVLVAEPAGDGWTLNGTAPWVTSWGTAAVMAVAAATTDRRMIWALLPASEMPGLRVSGTFDLMVYGATQTVALGFDDLAVGPESVLEVVDIDRWAERDRFMAARPNPLCLGVGDRALRLLADRAPEVAAGLQDWWAGVGERAEACALAVDRHCAELTEVASARAETLLGVQRLTTALLAAAGGGAMERDHPAQRLSREAMFYVIQAQSADGRQALFDQLGSTS